MAQKTVTKQCAAEMCSDDYCQRMRISTGRLYATLRKAFCRTLSTWKPAPRTNFSAHVWAIAAFVFRTRLSIESEQLKKERGRLGGGRSRSFISHQPVRIS